MTASTVPAAASSWVAERLAGPRRRAEIVARGRQATYIDVDGDCIGVLARDAVAVPIGLRTTLRQLPEMTRPIAVGDGGVAFARYDVVAARIVDPAVPRIGPVPPSAMSDAIRSRRHIASDYFRVLDLPTLTLRALADAEASAVLDLLGRGDGLTPVGDDVLSGWLVARRAIGRSTAPVAAAVSTHATPRTTPLSATLLRRAVDGEAVPPCRDLLLALRAGSGVDAALGRLLAVGHTSGAAIALGMSLALEGSG